MGAFFNTILTQPLLNLLVFFHNLIPGNDIGWAIIAVTIVVRILMLPVFRHQIKSQHEMQKIQPMMNEIKKKHKDDKAAQQKAIMEFYKENKINPLSACFPLLIQLPIFFALFTVFRTSLSDGGVVGQLYGFVADPGAISNLFLGLVDLSKPNLVLALLTGAFQFVQSKMMMARSQASGNKTTDMMGKQMLYMFPIISVVISMSLPSGLALYWIVTTLFSIGQQYYIMRSTSEAEAKTV